MKKDTQSEIKIAAGQHTDEEKYWLDRLSGEWEICRFPYDKKGGERAKRVPDNIAFEFPGPVSAKLLSISNNSDSRLFMILMAGLVVLIEKYTGNDDIIVGTPIYKQEIEGKFLNTVLSIRNRLEPGMTFKDLLVQVRQNILEADENQNYPLETLLYKLNLPLFEDECPLFDIGILLESIHIKEYFGRFTPNMLFAFNVDGGSVGGRLEYNSLLYSTAAAQRIAGHFLSLITALLDGVNRPLADVEMLSGSEREQVLTGFNNTAEDYPRDRTIHELFREQVEASPNGTAVVYGQQRLNYRELDEETDRLAGLLREKGVRPGIVVGLMLERSVEMVTGMLAVLKAGGAYVPIDPGAPAGRVSYMLKDCGVSLVLTAADTAKNHSYTSMQGLETVVLPPVVNPSRCRIDDFNSLPFPDRSLMDVEKYNRCIGQSLVKNRIFIQASRGCPFDCSYCYRIWPRKQMARTAENIFEEILLYYNIGMRKFDIFMLNIKEGKRLFQLIIQKGIKDLQLYFPNGFRGDLLTKEYIDLMVEAGTVNFALALETASPRLQKLINKHLDIEKFRENIEYACAEYPHVLLELFTLHGIPTETKEEARMTLDFIKSLKWVHFPYVNILKIYHNTGMEKLALESGVSRRSILESEHLAWHELSDTLPFDLSFSNEYQSDFLGNYLLSKERLLQVLPYQMKVLSEDEIVQKYDSYFPAEIKNFDDLLEFVGIREDELSTREFCDESKDREILDGLNRRIAGLFPKVRPAEDALKVLFLDLSQFFSDGTDMLYDVVDPPLGMLYILTYLNRELGEKIHGRILKPRMDFDSYEELKKILEEFKPDVIGVRSLSYYKDFMHETIAAIRRWGIDTPIVVGGPYATVDYETMLQDRNIDIAALSEGEVTFLDIVNRMIENGKKLPPEDVLREIPGIAFVPGENREGRRFAREIVFIDRLDRGPVKAVDSGAAPVPAARPSDLAYIMYTSGSTGTPKGVLIDHQNAVNVLTWFGKNYNLGSGTNVLQMTDYTFDPSVEQIFASLFRGASVFIADKELLLDRDAFARFIDTNNIHIMNAIPAVLNELLADRDKLRSLDTVISGGEKLDKDLKDRLLARGYRLYNQYGPTETTIDALAVKCTEGDVTIGRPIANTRCYILKSGDRTPVPVGVPGELCIGGAGVGRGYLNNIELSIEKFTGDPVVEETRIYRTGDMARWLPDGQVAYLGRIDRQVKIRGYRIEPGEIEKRLVSHKDIADAVVLALENKRENYLCAFVVITEDSPVTETVLREDLARRLPTYMIPRYFFKLNEFPRTAGGKIDYKSLEAMDITESNLSDDYVAPRNEAEKKLAEVWARVLGRDKVSITDDFFMIGGDSIKAIQVLSRLGKDGYKVDMRDLFEKSTVIKLAPEMRRTERTADQSVVTGIVPLTPIQAEFFQVSSIDPHHNNQAVMLYDAGGFDRDAVTAVFIRIQEHHDALRMTYKEENGTLVQQNHGLDYPFSLEVHDLRDRENAVERLESAAENVQAGIDLENGPLMKTALFRLDDGDRLLIVCHHLVIDTVSWRILFEDIETLLRQYKAGEPLELPLKTDSFKTWSECLSGYADSRSFLKEKEYWKGLGAVPVPAIPKDFEDGTNRVEDTDALSFQLSEEETRLLLTKVNDAFGTEINDILLTALGLGIRQSLGFHRFMIALEGHGREKIIDDLDISRTVGWFTALYPVVLDISFAEDLSRQLIDVKESLRRIPNKGIGYGILKYLTAPGLKEDIRLDLKPQICFNYLGQFDSELDQMSVETAKESTGKMMSGRAEREYEFDIFGMIAGNRLEMSIAYNKKQYKTETVRALLDAYRAGLERVIEFCVSRDKAEVTPSDLGYSELSVEELDTIFD